MNWDCWPEKLSSFQRAAFDGLMHTLRLHLQRAPDLLKQDMSTGATPLLAAIAGCTTGATQEEAAPNVECAKLLLLHGEDWKGQRGRWLALANDRVQMIRAFLECEQCIDVQDLGVNLSVLGAALACDEQL